jgi:gliding motility-associated-like protein
MVNVAASANNICEGTSIILSGSGASAYTWNNGITDGVAFTPSVGTTNYVLTGTDSNGCVNTDSIAIVVNPLPTVVANTDGNNICDGFDVTLTGFGAQSYVWDNGIYDGIAFIPAEGTSAYTVFGTDVNGCVNQASMDIIVNALPQLTITASSNGNALCEGDSLALNGSGALSYAWNNNVVDGVSFVPPVGNSSYLLTAVDSNACVNSDSLSILVNALPNLNINPSGNGLCDGESLTLNGGGAQSYVWNNGITDGFAFIPSVGTTNYVLTGTDLNGCVNTDSIEILVNALPNVIANTDGNNICDGFDVTLTGFGAQSYVWDNGIYDGIAFIPAVGTSAYTVFGTDINGCVNQAFIDLVVYSLPPVDVVANMNGNLICEGTAITLSGSGAQSYSWNNGVLDGISFVPPVGINSFAVTGISANACLNYDSIQITVNPLPIVVANLSANNVCDGDSVTLSCSNLAFHSWNQNIVDGVPFIAPVGTTTFVLTATDFNGCTNKDSIDVIVHPLPIILANSSDNQVCEGNTLALFGTGAASYVWNNGVQDGVAFMPPLGISLYKVTGTDINGCVNEDDIAIQAYNLPVINPVSSDNIVCEGESVTLIGAGAQSYIWSNGILNGVSFVPAVGVNAYIVTGTDANACISSDTIQVRVNPLPNVLANASSIAVCENEAIQLFGSGANSYVWAIGISDGDSIMPNLGFNVYAVTGTDLNGCMNTDTIGIMTDSLGELVALEDIIVCDEENISISSFSNNTIAYQWGIIENGLGNDLVSSADYMGTTTSQLFVSGLSQASVYTFYLEMTGACGNLLYDTMDLMVNQSPIVDLLEDTILCIHDSNTIFADLPNGESFVWNDGTEGQYISPEFAGMYYVSFEENGTGCLVSDTMFIEMEDCIDNCVLLAPSGFSPNGDGTNDGFRAIHTCDAGLSFFDMKIFNRWGEMVFQTSDPEASWDGIYKGGKAPLATYGFIIDYVKEYESKREVLKGNVSLIR